MSLVFLVVCLTICIIELIGTGNCLQCRILENEECKPRPFLYHTNLDREIRYYPFVLKIDRCQGSCDTFDEPMLRHCWGNKTKVTHAKVYDMHTDEFVAFKLYEDIACSCQCKYTESVCDRSQTWNKDKCRCEPFIVPDNLGSLRDDCTSTIVTDKPKSAGIEVHGCNLKPCTTYSGLSSTSITLLVLLCLTIIALGLIFGLYVSLKRKKVDR